MFILNKLNKYNGIIMTTIALSIVTQCPQSGPQLSEGEISFRASWCGPG